MMRPASVTTTWLAVAAVACLVVSVNAEVAVDDSALAVAHQIQVAQASEAEWNPLACTDSEGQWGPEDFGKIGAAA